MSATPWRETESAEAIRAGFAPKPANVMEEFSMAVPHVSGQPVNPTLPATHRTPATSPSGTSPQDGSQVQSYRTAGSLGTDTRGLPSDPTRSAQITGYQAETASRVTDGGGSPGRLTFSGGGGPEYAPGLGTIDHDARLCDPALDEKRLVPDGGQWDGARILNSVGQLDTAPRCDNQEVRCGASSMLAGAVMNGRDATLAFTERLAENVKDPREVEQLKGIRERLADGSATNADLHQLQSITYECYHLGKQGGLNGDALSTAQVDLAANVQFDPGDGDQNARGARVLLDSALTLEQPGRTDERIQALKSGQSYTQGVDANGDGKADHVVQVGRDPNGRAYLYDPYPTSNQPYVIYQDENPQAFNHYADGSMGINAPNGTRVNVVVGGTQAF